MTTVLDDNVHNFAVDGSSDDLDVPIKAVFADLDYSARYTLHRTLATVFCLAKMPLRVANVYSS